MRHINIPSPHKATIASHHNETIRERDIKNQAKRQLIIEENLFVYNTKSLEICNNAIHHQFRYQTFHKVN